MSRITVAQLAQKLDDHLGFINDQMKEIKIDTKEIKLHLQKQNSRVFKLVDFKENHMKLHEKSTKRKDKDIQRAIALTGLVSGIVFSIIGVIISIL